jgi:hypothetical protein
MLIMKKKALVTILLFVAVCSESTYTHSQNAAASTTGKAIASGLNGFLSVAFPAASTIVTLVQNWLSKKLDDKQQKQVTTGATQKQTEVDKQLADAKASIQDAANTLKLTSAVLYRTNKATADVTAMIAILDTTRAQDPLPFSRLNQKWSDAKAELSGLKADSTLQKARAAITDTAVSNALQGLDDVTGGPVSNVNDNMKPTGDHGILREELNKILSATVDFNNLGVVLLGSTGTEITKVIGNSKVAGGGSALDLITEKAVQEAALALPKPKSTGH